MKKLLLIILLLIPVNLCALSFGCKESPPPIEKYTLIDPMEGIDYVFAIKGSKIRQVGVINYFNFSITYLKKSLRKKSELTAGEESDPPDQRRKELDNMIRESWPGVDRVQYYIKKN